MTRLLVYVPAVITALSLQVRVCLILVQPIPVKRATLLVLPHGHQYKPWIMVMCLVPAQVAITIQLHKANPPATRRRRTTVMIVMVYRQHRGCRLSAHYHTVKSLVSVSNVMIVLLPAVNHRAIQTLQMCVKPVTAYHQLPGRR